ncbi:MAG: hypothetical protein E7207_00010 [Clostridium butyricum]|nr:hypothetical protein [Clostridium butyricum]
MDCSEIISYLDENGLADVEEVKQDDEYELIKFYYDFDKEEISAAKSYSNEESDYEEESDEWYREYYIPYLKDIAVDNAESIIEDVMDEFEVQAFMKEIGMENGESGYFKFVMAVSDSMDEAELEELLNDYED